MLSQSEVDAILKEFDTSVGCPVTVNDRLHAFALGAVSMMNLIKERVSMDDKPAQTHSGNVDP